jgi:hypothetical protein
LNKTSPDENGILFKPTKITGFDLFAFEAIYVPLVRVVVERSERFSVIKRLHDLLPQVIDVFDGNSVAELLFELSSKCRFTRSRRTADMNHQM